MKAIETRYNGYRFRSRLEARWAVFFDTLEIPYVYEPEGFELDEAGRYLPDFFLPEENCWIEIKPTYPTDKELDKAYHLAKHTRTNVYVYFGNIGKPKTKDIPFTNEVKLIDGSAAYEFAINIKEEKETQVFLEPRIWAWQENVSDGRICIWPLHIINPLSGVQRMIGIHDIPDWNEKTPKLLSAYDKARQARFEFGETP